jgi:hypothetical protein
MDGGRGRHRPVGCPEQPLRRGARFPDPPRWAGWAGRVDTAGRTGPGPRTHFPRAKEAQSTSFSKTTLRMLFAFTLEKFYSKSCPHLDLALPSPGSALVLHPALSSRHLLHF